MVPLNQRTVEAFARLRTDPEFAVVLKYLDASRSAAVAAMTALRDETSVRWAQGTVQTLDEILKTAEQAVELAHRFRDQR